MQATGKHKDRSIVFKTRQNRISNRQTHKDRSIVFKTRQNRISNRQTHKDRSIVFKTRQNRASNRQTHNDRSIVFRTRQNRASNRQTHKDRSIVFKTRQNRASSRQTHKDRSSVFKTRQNRASNRQTHKDRTITDMCYVLATILFNMNVSQRDDCPQCYLTRARNGSRLGPFCVIGRTSCVQPASRAEPNSKHWFTTPFLGGRCRNAMFGVWGWTQTPSTGLPHPPTTAINDYAISLRKLSASNHSCFRFLSANEQWCSNGSKRVTDNSNYIRRFSFITAHVAYVSTNKTKIVWIETELFFYPGRARLMFTCVQGR